MGNYRPITLIPVLAKLFEKLMAKRINAFIKKHNIIKDNQFGFQEGKSTCLASFAFIKKVTEGLNNKLPTIAIFLDMSKAFDCVHYNALLNKLSDYGLRGAANKWLESYLSNKQQCTEISRIENKVTTRSKYRQTINIT